MTLHFFLTLQKIESSAFEAKTPPTKEAVTKNFFFFEKLTLSFKVAQGCEWSHRTHALLDLPALGIVAGD